jgi:hypothetical protein
LKLLREFDSPIQTEHQTEIQELKAFVNFQFRENLNSQSTSNELPPFRLVEAPELDRVF